MRTYVLVPLLAALAALSQMEGCGVERGSGSREKKAAEAAPPSPVDQQARIDSITREMHRMIDSITGEAGVSIRRDGNRTIITAGGQRTVFDTDGNVTVDEIPAEAPDAAAPEPRGLQPDLGTGGLDAFVTAEEAVWGYAGEFSGTGDGETPVFRVRSREFRVITRGKSAWPIAWRIADLQSADGGKVQTLRMEEPGADTTYVHAGPGAFRLVMKRFDGAWQARVEEKLLPAERMP
ncbi:MAG TPA: hypothetical protein VFQ39_18635 [Longimicrobium sp.]|nr:hypothetical protein [Longimicrobium sp.]